MSKSKGSFTNYVYKRRGVARQSKDVDFFVNVHKVENANKGGQVVKEIQNLVNVVCEQPLTKFCSYHSSFIFSIQERFVIKSGLYWRKNKNLSCFNIGTPVFLNFEQCSQCHVHHQDVIRCGLANYRLLYVQSCLLMMVRSTDISAYNNHTSYLQ